MNFCTLFDSNFITYGLTLHDSLNTNSANFTLYVVAFDDSSYEFLKELGLPNMIVISLAEFEDEKLLAIKPTRSKGEYCWTCTSSVIAYCLKQYNLDHCIYLDADIYFYDDPSVLLSDVGDNSVLITPHWYYPRVDTSAQTGKYCVQFVYFKNDANGNRVLNWWRDACIEWCFNRIEDGKFGDQKYLDGWQEQFDGVFVLENRGGGVAPWNADSYTYQKLPAPSISYNSKEYKVVFFHFHGLRMFTDEAGEKKVNLGNYKLPKAAKEIYYVPYIKALLATEKLLNELNFKNKLINSFVFKKQLTLKEKIYNLIYGINNIHNVNKIIK